MMKLEASTGAATATPSGLRSRSSMEDTVAATTTTTTLLPAAHTRPTASLYTARADSSATLATAASSFAPMRTWCDGVQRVTQQYFAALGMLAMTFLGAEGVPRPGSSSSADGLRRDLRVVRGDFQDDEELHVEADDVAAMQMALLQQLYAHRKLQQRKRHSARRQSTVLRAAEGAATNMAHPSSASAGTRDDRDVSARHGSWNADADEAAATAVPARNVAELLASRLPPELLQLFHTAQTLRASAPAADTSPSSSFLAVAGRAPVSAGGQGWHSARFPRDEGRATPDECDREEDDIDGVDAGADDDLYRPLSRESAASVMPLMSERPHSSSTSAGAVSLSAAGSPSRLCSASTTRAEPPSHIVPASPPQPPSAAPLPVELSDEEAAEAAAMATLCYQYFCAPRLLSPPRSAAAPAMPPSKAPAAAAAAPQPAPPSKVVVVPAAVAAGSGLDAVLMMQLAQEPQLPPPRRARRATPPLTAVMSASYASASGTGGGSPAATTSTAAPAPGSAPHPPAPEPPSPADLSTPAAWRRLIAQRVAAEHAVKTLAHTPSATLSQTTGVPPSTAATATGAAAAAALPPPTTLGPHEEEAAAAGPVPELASTVRHHVHAQLSFGLAPQQRPQTQTLKQQQQQQPEQAATSAQGAPASADGAHGDAPPRTAPSTAASTAPGSRAGHAGSGGSSGGGGDRKTEGHARAGAAPTTASVKPGSAGDAMRLAALPSRASSPATSAVGGGMAQQQQQAGAVAAVVEDGGPASAITAGGDSSAAAPVPVVLSAALPDVTATATATSKSPSRSGRDTTQRTVAPVPKKRARVDSAHLRRARGLLPPPTNVVLPPGHSGFNGEKLTTTQLAQLVVSVKQDGAAAQVSAQQQQTAGDVAAAELYRLQRAVAQLLVENVQLEKDIATLAAGAPAETGRVAAAAAAATAVAPVESRRRPLILPPAPMPLPHASAALTANSLLVGRPATDRKGKGRGGAASAASFTGRGRDDAVIVVAQRPWQRQVAALAGNAQSTTTTSRKAAPRAYSPTAAAAARASSEAAAAAAAAAAPLADPAAILQELCSAASAREEERLRTLAEIDALASRVEHHDALLSAVAEYWRRNAAIMKRQQYAVQSQPKNSATTTAATSVAATRAMHSPAGASPLCEDEVPGVGGNGGVLAAPVPYLMHAAVTAGSAASSRDDSGASSPVDKGSPSATLTGAMSLSEKMTTLDGSPSQLQRALAQMEALSPTPPSSSLSFDLRPNHTSASGLGYSPEVIGHVVRRQILPVRLKTATTTSSNATDVRGSMPTAPTSTTLHKTAALPPAAVTESTPSDGTNTNTAITATTGLGSVAATSGRQPHGNAASSANTNTSTTLLYSRGGRRIDTGPQAHAGGRAAVKSAATEATITTAESDFGAAARSDAELPSDSFGTSPRTLSSSAPNFSPTNGTDAADENTNAAGGSSAGQPAATNTTTARASAAGVLHRSHAASPYSAEETAVGSPDMHASHTSMETTSRHYASGSGRREDENVLERGNWRTIPALQLENLDEIAEFIYSVFEQP